MLISPLKFYNRKIVMKGVFFVIFVNLLFLSCATTNFENLVGKYKGIIPRAGSFVPTSEMVLNLKQDETFYLLHRRTNYTGIWRIHDDKILLEFNEVDDPIVYLTSGGVPFDEFSRTTLKIINPRKLRYSEYTVLKRVK